MLISVAQSAYQELNMRYMKWGLAAIAAAVVVACGGGGGTGGPASSFGGGSDGGTKVSITSVKVFGDSLVDSGVFGFKFNVQNASNPAGGYPIWTELVAANYGLSVCPFFRATSATAFIAPVGACGSFGIGGGRINNPAANGGAAAPYSIPYQMQTAASVVTYGTNDLVLIDGGGNDAADLFGAYLAASRDGGASFQALVGTLLTPAQIGAIATANPGAASFLPLGVAYMQALADKFSADIATNVTGKGATRVVLLNAPNVTGTPRFQEVLGLVAAGTTAAGGDGAAAAAGAAKLATAWIEAYNAKLAANVSANGAIALVDFYTSFNDQLANPGAYGLTNVKTPACPGVKNPATGQTDYSFTTCADAALNAAPPAGLAANWWQTYGFSDGFHPTPNGYKLLAQYVGLTLAKKGWL
jgi:outer membrane lipase/esterase